MLKYFWFILTILLCGIAHFYSLDFHHIWWLTWLAPMPLLIYLRRADSWFAASAAFIVGATTVRAARNSYLNVTIKSGLVKAKTYTVSRQGTTLIARVPSAASNSFYEQHSYIFIPGLMLLLLVSGSVTEPYSSFVNNH